MTEPTPPSNPVHPFLRGGMARLFIDGQWVDAASGEDFEVVNPATEERLTLVAKGNAADIDRAVLAARRAFETVWSRTRPSERQALLLRFADIVERRFEDLALIDTLDVGAPISRSRSRKDYVLQLIRYYAAMAVAIHGNTTAISSAVDCFAYTTKEPVGVVGAIIPWNGPLVTSIWKICAALCTGCTIVLKPAEEAPLTALLFGELLQEAGLPPGCVNIVAGGAQAGAALAAHPDIDKMSFTGSARVGREIVSASAVNFKQLTLELGGKSANIVFDDANLDLAIPGAATAIFANSGQVCSAGSRLLVQRGLYDRFLDRLVAYARSLRVGDSLDPATDMGPLTSGRHRERVENFIRIGTAEGARVATGGGRPASPACRRGFFLEPTIFADATNGMRISQEEIFGPVLSVIPFVDREDAIAKANASMYGLGGGVWTENIGNAEAVARGLRTGTVWVNCYQVMDPAMPFGGYKSSGYGREAGREHIDGYLNVKSVFVRRS